MSNLVGFDIYPQVREALAQDRPVVALESALITHGLPWPDNLATARVLEQAVRSEGAVPATIGVVGGRIKVGLTGEELERLAGPHPSPPSLRRGGRDEGRPTKITLRDLALAVIRAADGGTTVAATAWAAYRAGIRVFATGGIGGVHRGQPFDVSADLPALAATPIVVVCSGAKAILDLPLTLEWLETHGVPVLGYQTEELPAFYSRESGLPVDARVDSPDEVVALARTHWGLGLATALLVAVPPPGEVALPPETVDTAIRRALAEAEAEGVHGRKVTPFLLARVAELTGGESRATNVALLENNARVAARLAKAFHLES